MTRRLTLTQFQGWLTHATPELEAAAVKGMRSAALYLNRTVVLEISQTEPRPAVDTGELRNSVNVTMVPDGAIVSVDAPHAGVIEYGRRPGGRQPPLQPLIDWVLRHPELLKDGMKAQRAALKRQTARAAKVVGKAYARRAARAQGIPGREVAARGVAFVIARSIARKGIAPRHYFAKAWTRSEANMTAAILLAIAKTGSWKPTAKGRIAIQTMFKVGPKGPGAP